MASAHHELTGELPSGDTYKTLYGLTTFEARKSISRFRALKKSSFVWIERQGPDLPSSTRSVPGSSDKDDIGEGHLKAKQVEPRKEPRITLRARAILLARERGEVRTKELTDIGVPRCYLARMCAEGLLVKVAYGRYRAADPK